MAPAEDGSYVPNLSTYLRSLEQVEDHQTAEHAIEICMSLLKRRQISHSRASAIAIISLLTKVVQVHPWTNVDSLIARVRDVGARLIAAQPREVAVGNVVRRVLALIREEAEEDRSRTQEAAQKSPAKPKELLRLIPGLGFSNQRASTTYKSPHAPVSCTMFNLLAHPDASPGSSGLGTPVKKNKESPTSALIRADILEGLSEIADELSQASDQIASYAVDHIHPGEIIMTCGASITVQKYFLEAAKNRRRFVVIHAETHPNDSRKIHHLVSHSSKVKNKAAGVIDAESGKITEWVRPLSEAGIKVILVPDAAVFALMARIDKVILSPVAVLANGGLVAGGGTRTIAIAAQDHHVPVMALAPTYKLSPVFPYDERALVQWGSSMKVLPYEDVEAMTKLRVLNPLLDYVEPALIDLFMTNIGGIPPSYLHKVLEDNYRVADLVLLDPKAEKRKEERRELTLRNKEQAREKLKGETKERVEGQVEEQAGAVA
ncbi:MAG: GCD complex subunit gcd7 [Vezdaea aestivalis]|nr:MAG: GCD complex subunit gcd7 [Vezdaea aestivalis]